MEYSGYSKINLGLDVIRRREDGYHDLRMIMQTLQLRDVIDIQIEDSDSLEIKMTCTDNSLCLDESNLCVKAASLLLNEFNISSKVTINLEKNIPIAAGMAGGSADAAAVLIGINDMFKLGLSKEELIKRGVKIGADVPFCLTNMPARVQGIGEEIRIIKPKHQYECLIVKPDEGLSTRKIFEYADTLELEHGNGDEVEKCLVSGDDNGLANALFNGLEKPSINKIGEIGEIKEYLKSLGFSLVLMSGSGSSVFALSTDHRLIYKAYKKLEKEDYNVILTRTL